VAPGPRRSCLATTFTSIFDGVDQQYVVALDKKTGQTVWKKPRAIDYKTAVGDLKKAYGTPTIVDVAGKPQLISPAAVATIAYDPFTGDEIWKVYHGGMNAAMPPLAGLGRVFIGTGYGGWRLVRGSAGRQGRTSLPAHVDWNSAPPCLPAPRPCCWATFSSLSRTTALWWSSRPKRGSWFTRNG